MPQKEINAFLGVNGVKVLYLQLSSWGLLMRLPQQRKLFVSGGGSSWASPVIVFPGKIFHDYYLVIDLIANS